MIHLPDSYYIAAGLCALLLIVALLYRHRAWAWPFGTVAATIGAWYLIEPFYFPELFEQFNFVHVRTAYDSVSIFCIALLVMAPTLANSMQPKAVTTNLSTEYIPADRVLVFVVLVWLALLGFGTWRMNGDLIGALFPVGARAAGHMWAREGGAGAGGSGFIISSASYIYVLCLAAFGVLFFLVRKQTSYLLLIVLILVSWPYVFLQGARNLVLATVVPGGLAFLLFSRVPPLVKLVATVVGFVALDLALRIIVAYRNTGFAELDFSAVQQSSHLGLNMASELAYITTFLSDGTVALSYGMGYLAELLNVIPRAIWPDKPLIGIDYSIARGFGDALTDIGVFTTISSGAIGQGVLNFGSIFGPIASAFLLSVWIGVLARLRSQATPLRRALFLVGLGLTFNLGRDITLLVLWPIVFGYLGVRLFERYDSRRRYRLELTQQGTRRIGIS